MHLSHRDYAVGMFSAAHPNHNDNTEPENHQLKEDDSAGHEANIRNRSYTEPKAEKGDSRRRLVADSIVGFVGFFAVIAFIEAVVNVFRPEPEIMPAAVALILVVAAVAAMRWRNRYV